MDNHAIDPEAFARRYQDEAAALDDRYPPWRMLTGAHREIVVAAAEATLAGFGVPVAISVATPESDAEFLARRTHELTFGPPAWSGRDESYRRSFVRFAQQWIDAGVVTVNRDTPVTGPDPSVIEMHDADVDLSSVGDGFILTISGPRPSTTPGTSALSEWKQVDATLTIRPALDPTP